MRHAPADESVCRSHAEESTRHAPAEESAGNTEGCSRRRQRQLRRQDVRRRRSNDAPNDAQNAKAARGSGGKGGGGEPCADGARGKCAYADRRGCSRRRRRRRQWRQAVRRWRSRRAPGTPTPLGRCRSRRRRWKRRRQSARRWRSRAMMGRRGRSGWRRRRLTGLWPLEAAVMMVAMRHAKMTPKGAQRRAPRSGSREGGGGCPCAAREAHSRPLQKAMGGGEGRTCHTAWRRANT